MKTKKMAGGGNIQTLGNIKFDSDKSRPSDDGSYQIVKDQISGKEFGVVRQKNGSYDFYRDPVKSNDSYKSVTAYYREYLDSPKNKERAENDLGGFYYKTKAETLKTPVFYNGGKHIKNSGYSPKTNTIELGYPSPSKEGQRLYDEGAVLAHEFSHSRVRNAYAGEAFQKLDTNFMSDKINDPHDQLESEYRADIDAFRYLLRKNDLYNPSKDTFTKKHLEEGKKKLKGILPVDRLLENSKSEDALIQAMNSYTAVQQGGKTQSAAYGGAIAGVTGGLSMLTEAYNYKPSLNQQAPSLLNGAVSGAAAGASFGLPGLALGALVGLGTSAYKQNKDANTVVFGSPGAYAYGGPVNTPINPPVDSTGVALPVLRQIGLEAILQQEAAHAQRMREVYRVSPSFGQGTSSVSKSKDRFHEKAMGGDISLNNSAFQVQGNPNIQDSEAYNYQGQNLKLDHNEVVDTAQDFVYSNKVYNPLTNNTFAKDASTLQRSKGKSEEKVKLYADKISETTMNLTNKSLDGLRALHQIVGTSKTTKMAKGGPFNWMEPLAQLQRDPQLVRSLRENLSNPLVKYYPPTLPTEAPAYEPETTDISEYMDYVNKATQVSSRTQAPQDMLDYLANPMAGGTVTPPPEENPFTTGDYMQMLGSLGTIIPYLDGAEREKAYTDNSTITKQSFDVNPQLYQNNRNYQNAINNVDTGSGSLRRAIQNQLYATKLNQDNQVVEQYQNLNNQATTQYQDRVSNQQRYNNSQITYTNDINAANRAQQDAGVATGFANLSDFGKALNSKEIDNRQLKLLKILYPDGFKSYQLQNG